MTDKKYLSQKPPRVAWSALIWAILLLYLSVQAAQLALFLGRWPAPVQYGSIIVLFVMSWLIWRGFQKFIQWGRTLTLKRIVTSFMIALAVIVFFVGMNNPSEHGPLRSFQDATISISRTAGQLASNGFWEIVRFPSQMWIVYTDHSISDGELNEKNLITGRSLKKLSKSQIRQSHNQKRIRSNLVMTKP